MNEADAESGKTTNPGRPIRIDANAASTRADTPGFLARPLGAPVYHGFPVLDDVEVDGFRLGMISDWEASPGMNEGDAFVVAPDGSRCGINWYVSRDSFFRQVLPPDRERWGVWDVSFAHEMNSRENASRNLAAVIPHLTRAWTEWRQAFSR